MPKAVDVCAGCGALLEAPDAVCPACNPPLTDGPPGTAAGRYLCPSCNTRFGAAHQLAWPPQAAWYQFQHMTPQCPNCQAFLQDRWSMRPLSVWQILGIFAGLQVAIAIFKRVNAQWVLFAALCGLLVWRLWHDWRIQSVIAEEHRYASKPPS